MTQLAPSPPSRSYEHMIERLRAANVLTSALFELTYRCNLDCYFCYNDLARKGREMETADWCRALDELADLGALEIALSGGEPMVFPGFFEIARHAGDVGMVVRIKTNGHLLDAARCRRLAEEVKPLLLEISLHGAQAESHERQTRVSGSFRRLLDHLEVARAAGLRVQLKSALTRWNEDEVDDMLALADGLGLSIVWDTVVTPRDDGDTSPLVVSPSRAGVAHLFRRLTERQERDRIECGEQGDANAEAGAVTLIGTAPTETRKSCGTGSTTVTVDPYGNVFPCVQWRRPLGNLHEQSLAEIWSGSPALAEVRRLSLEAGARLDAMGPGARDMGFCLGLAEELTGDPLAIYPQVEQKRSVLQGLEQDASSAAQSPPNETPTERPRLPIFGQDVA